MAAVRPAEETVVLITGCSKGSIGYAQAEEFARYGGCKVYATARKPERMAGLDKLGCSCLKLDITDDDNVKSVVDEVLRREGHIDVLVNNAGAAARGTVLDVPLDATKKLFEVNLYGQIRMIKAVAPHMIRQRSGTIMNIGSMAALWSVPYLSSYSASKAALQAVSDAARVELKPFNVHVVHVVSGWVKTNIFQNTAQSGLLYAPEDSFYAPIRNFLETDVFKSIGIFPADPHSVSRQLVRVALKRHPPPVTYVGRWVWNVWFCAHFVPYWVLDMFCYYTHGLYKLAVDTTHEPPSLQQQQQQQQPQQQEQEQQRQEQQKRQEQEQRHPEGSAAAEGPGTPGEHGDEGAKAGDTWRNAKQL